MKVPPPGLKLCFSNGQQNRSVFFKLQRQMEETLNLSQDPSKCLASTFRKRLMETGRLVQFIPDLPPVFLSLKRGVPPSTLPPSGTRRASITPAAGAGTCTDVCKNENQRNSPKHWMENERPRENTDMCRYTL